MEKLTSLKNPKIQFWRSLHEKKARDESHCFLVEGTRSVQDALHSGFQMEALLISEEYTLPIPAENTVPEYLVPAHVLASVCDTKTPQGICAVMRQKLQPVTGPHLVALDSLQDPGNVGTILRTADAAGLDGILLSRNCPDLYSPKVLRATMGSIFHLPAETPSHLPDRLRALRAEGYMLLSTELGGEPFFSFSPGNSKWCLIIGNEGNGVSGEVRSLATHHLTLPMRGGAESLNASIAAGIMMYVLMQKASPFI